VHEGRLVSSRPDEPANLGGDEGQESSGSSIRPLVCGVSDTEPEQSSEVRRGEASRGRWVHRARRDRVACGTFV